MVLGGEPVSAAAESAGVVVGPAAWQCVCHSDCAGCRGGAGAACADPLPDLSIYIRYSIISLALLQSIPLIIILTMVSRDKYLSSNAQGTIIKIVGDVFLTNFILYFFGKTFV